MVFVVYYATQMLPLQLLFIRHSTTLEVTQCLSNSCNYRTVAVFPIITKSHCQR